MQRKNFQTGTQTTIQRPSPYIEEAGKSYLEKFDPESLKPYDLSKKKKKWKKKNTNN